MTSTGETPDISFWGADGNECERFIAAIEELAFTEGWSEDRKRMLLFARSRLRHRALRWFARLDPSKKNDWDLFVEALFDQYPLVEAPGELEIATPIWSATTFSPSASTVILPVDQVLGSQPSVEDDREPTTANRTRPSMLPNHRAYDPSILGRQIGILRIVVEDGTMSPEYVWRGHPTLRRLNDRGWVINNQAQHEELRTTVDRQNALVVCFVPSPEPHPIGCRDLALRYHPHQAYSYELRAWNGLTTIKEDGSSTNTGQDSVSKVWNILSDGSLQASLCVLDPSSCDSYTGKYAKEDFKTTEVHLDTSGTSVWFVKPGTPLWQDDPNRNTQLSRSEIKARIVFEPL